MYCEYERYLSHLMMIKDCWQMDFLGDISGLFLTFLLPPVFAARDRRSFFWTILPLLTRDYSPTWNKKSHVVLLHLPWHGALLLRNFPHAAVAVLEMNIWEAPSFSIVHVMVCYVFRLLRTSSVQLKICWKCIINSPIHKHNLQTSLDFRGLIYLNKLKNIIKI